MYCKYVLSNLFSAASIAVELDVSNVRNPTVASSGDLAVKLPLKEIDPAPGFASVRVPGAMSWKSINFTSLFVQLRTSPDSSPQTDPMNSATTAKG